MKEKLLSISIAAYNCENFIRETLDSLCEESVLPYLEIFVIDDGGQDGTLDIAKEYRKIHGDSIIPIHKSNGGWGSTVNYAIKNATGKYFKLLDGDDYFFTEGLKEIVSLLGNYEVDVIYTPYVRFEDKSKRVLEYHGAPDGIDRNRILQVSDIFESVKFVMHSSMFKTQLLKDANVNVLEHCFYTDNEYVAKGLVNSQTAMITDVELYEYRVGREGQSVDVSGLKKHYKDNYKVIDELCRYRLNLQNSQSKEMMHSYIVDAVNFQSLALILLGNKQEYTEFDKSTIKKNIQTNSMIQVKIRKSSYRLYAFFRFLILIKKRIGKILKPVKGRAEYKKKECEM